MGLEPTGPGGWTCSRSSVSTRPFSVTCEKGRRAVRAVFAEGARARLALRIGGGAPAPRTRRRTDPKVECYVGGPQTYRVAPRNCALYEHGTGPTLTVRSMTWRNWGKRRTRGRGTIHFFDHPDSRGRVLVVLHRIWTGHCVPGRYYTAARIKVLSGPSEGDVLTLNLAAGCPA